MKTEKKKSKVGIYILSGALTVFLLALVLSFNDISRSEEHTSELQSR